MTSKFHLRTNTPDIYDSSSSGYRTSISTKGYPKLLQGSSSDLDLPSMTLVSTWPHISVGLSDDYVRYYEQMLNEVPSQQSTTILSRQQSHHKSNPALYESSPESPAKPSRYPSRHDVSAPRDPPSSLNGHDYPDNTNTRQDEQAWLKSFFFVLTNNIFQKVFTSFYLWNVYREVYIERRKDVFKMFLKFANF